MKFDNCISINNYLANDVTKILLGYKETLCPKQLSTKSHGSQVLTSDFYIFVLSYLSNYYCINKLKNLNLEQHEKLILLTPHDFYYITTYSSTLPQYIKFQRFNSTFIYFRSCAQ